MSLASTLPEEGKLPASKMRSADQLTACGFAACCRHELDIKTKETFPLSPRGANAGIHARAFRHFLFSTTRRVRATLLI